MAPSHRDAASPDLRAIDDEPPPGLGSWRHLYAMLIAELVLIVLGLYALTRWAS